MAVSVDLGQCVFLVRRDVIGLVAFNLILRVVFRCAPGVALVIEITGVNPGDLAGYVTCLGIPFYMITDFEFRHIFILLVPLNQPQQNAVPPLGQADAPARQRVAVGNNGILC